MSSLSFTISGDIAALVETADSLTVTYSWSRQGTAERHAGDAGVERPVQAQQCRCTGVHGNDGVPLQEGAAIQTADSFPFRSCRVRFEDASVQPAGTCHLTSFRHVSTNQARCPHGPSTDTSHVRVPRREHDDRAGVDESGERSHSPALGREGGPMRNVGPDPDVDVIRTADGASGDGFFPLGDDYDPDERAHRTYWVVLVGPIPGIYSNKHDALDDALNTSDNPRRTVYKSVAGRPAAVELWKKAMDARAVWIYHPDGTRQRFQSEALRAQGLPPPHYFTTALRDRRPEYCWVVFNGSKPGVYLFWDDANEETAGEKDGGRIIGFPDYFAAISEYNRRLWVAWGSPTGEDGFSHQLPVA